MKKTKIFSIVFAVGLLSLVATGCGNPSGGNPDVKKETHNAKSTDLIKFKLNVTDAKYLATQWADETDEKTARAAYARDAEGTEDKAASPLDTLVAVVEDENGELAEETVMEVPVEELKLAEWCVPQPVREIYQCPYPTAEDAAKGIYTVFACYINWWKYTDETPAPGISMLMYAKPDGTTVDVLNKDGKVDYYLTTWQKESEGEDYIQFDQNGNLFALAHDDTAKEYLIFRYHPDTDKLDTYKLTNIKGDVYIRNFKVTKDGKWIFLNVMVDDKKNNVYAIQINTTNAPVSLYEYQVEEEPEVATWAVSSIGINPKTQNVYWYVDDYNDIGRPNAGLYVAEADINGNYSKANVTRYHSVEWWQILDYVKTNLFNADPSDIDKFRADTSYQEVIPASKNTDYSGLLKYLKGLCYYKGDIELNFSVFADMTNVTGKWIDANGVEHVESNYDFSKLAEGNLKDEEALKYLFETSYADVMDIENPDDWSDNNLFSNMIERFYNDCWKQGGLAEDSGYLKLSDSTEVAFPLQYIMFKKGTTENAFIPPKTETFFKSAFGSKMNGIILANNDGTWVISDVWDETLVNRDKTNGNNDHSVAFKLTDKAGNFECTQPGKLSKLTFRPKWDYNFQHRDETDPWYQLPVVTNSDGLAAITKDRKSIYYHSGDVTKDLIEGTTYQIDIAAIYSFKLQDDKLLYNAVNINGGYLMVSIDLTTGEDTKLPLEKKVESMLGL